MRRHLLIPALVLAFPLLFAAEVVDRVVAVVNAHAILLSELDTAARLEALLDHKPLDSITETSRRATFERMIDQELLRGETQNSSVTRSAPKEVAAKLLEVRQQYSVAAADAEWAAILQRYGVTQGDVEMAVADELDGLRLVDSRLRSSALPDASQIERYYHTVYEPDMRTKRAKPAALAQVTPQIREILTQQKLADLTATWLQTLRAQASIQINIKLPEAVAKP
jgi:hypothetical protein